jgi:hypothetical protein
VVPATQLYFEESLIFFQIDILKNKTVVTYTEMHVDDTASQLVPATHLKKN